MKKFAGAYSLAEMLIVLTLMAILVCLAIPALQQTIARQNNLLRYLQLKSAIKYAQEEAIRRMLPIVICPANYNSKGVLIGCLGHENTYCQGWSCGVLAYIDFERSGSYAAHGSGNLRINATRFDPEIAISASSAGLPVKQLLIAADGLIGDSYNGSSWVFQLSESKFKHRSINYLYLNRYGVFCQGGTTRC